MPLSRRCQGAHHVRRRCLARVRGRQRGAQFAEPSALYGVPLLSFISEPTTRHLYDILLDRVRAEQIVIRVPLRCDSPTLRRWLELEMAPRPADGVAFTSRELRTEARDPVIAFDRPASSAAPLVRMCSWCKKVETQRATWLEVEQAVPQLGLFAVSEVPGITHGICPECVKLFERGAGFSVSRPDG